MPRPGRPGGGAGGRGRAALLAAGALALAACNGATEPVGADDVPEMPADQVVEGVTFTVTVEGVRQALLLSDTAYVHEDSAAVDLIGMDLRVFDDGGRETAHVTSTTGVLNTRTQAMIARGNVRVVTGQPSRVITTEELFYDPNGNRIWSDVPTTIVEGGQTVRGRQGFESDAEFRNLRIKGASGESLRVGF